MPQSVGSQRSGHDLAAEQQPHITCLGPGKLLGIPGLKGPALEQKELLGAAIRKPSNDGGEFR